MTQPDDVAAPDDEADSPDVEAESADDELGDLLADLITRQESGETIVPHRITAEYPQHAEAIREFFGNQVWLQPTTASERPPGLSTGSLTGETIDDFQLIGEIARGGMGVVYEAIQCSLKRPVAMKLISDGVLADDELRIRFRMEAEAAAMLSHPSILPIHAIGCWRGIDYFVMPLVTGSTLQDRVLHREKQITAPETKAAVAEVIQQSLTWVREIARGVAYAHRRGIIHRDLKPENVMLDGPSDDAPQPLIVDFGLAKWHREAASASSPQLTRDGQVLGTPHYMSPEQARGDADVTAASDIYALGGILFALLTGRPPHAGATTAEVLASVLADEPPSLRLTWPGGLPRLRELADLDNVIARAMAADPRARYRSADDLADDVDRVLRGDSPEAMPDRLVDRFTREIIRDTHGKSFSNWGRALRRIGVVVLAAHVVMFAIARFQPDSMWWGYFAPRMAMLAGIGWIIHRSRDGLWLPRLSAERPVWSIWLGYLLTLGMVNAMWLVGVLDGGDVMLAACLNSGFAFIAMAGHLWGGSAILGGLFFVAAWLAVAFPDFAALFVGGSWMIAMWILGGRYAGGPS